MRTTSEKFEPGLEHARALDRADELASFRRLFHLPRRGSRALTYLCGHSLGLMPKRARAAVDVELERWATRAVEGHFDEGGWLAYHERFAAPLAELVGAAPAEVVAMNSLTVNLHLMLASFYAPSGGREKILIERGAFPSDRYAVESQLRWHGRSPDRCLLELETDPRTGLIEIEQFETMLARHGETVALVLLPGVQFLSGQALDAAAYTRIARRYGCRIGFDLAHALGNIPLAMHASGADFAVWCSYKYLNGGPGAIGGCFVHERGMQDETLPRLAGWWGHDKSSRFRADVDFAPIPTAEAWQLSNPPILAMAPLSSSLEIFARAGRAALRAKSERLTAYLEFLLTDELGGEIEVITPPARGAQLSLRLPRGAEAAALVQRDLRAGGVVADWRADLLRLAPVPLYNRFTDVHAAVRALARALRTSR
jgi:kynureninase